MAKPLLPRDGFGAAVPALGLGATTTLTAGAASAALVLPSEAFIVRVAAVNDCYIAFGSGAVAASTASAFFPRGAEVFKVPPEATHFACLQHTAGGVVTVTAVE